MIDHPGRRHHQLFLITVYLWSVSLLVFISELTLLVFFSEEADQVV